MIFNPDLFNEAQEVIFSRKTGKVGHPKVTSIIYQFHVLTIEIVWTYIWMRYQISTNLHIKKLPKRIRKIVLPEDSSTFFL